MSDLFVHENQTRRWLKYGSNSVLHAVVVLLLAGVVIWGAQKFRKRADLTEAGAYSLQPQTVNLIKDLKRPVKLVSLYPRLKQEPGTEAKQDFYQPVLDILDEYRRRGSNITVDNIDPVQNPLKLDKWYAEITTRYGGDVKGYRELLENFPRTLKQIKALADEEVKQIESKLAKVEFTDQEQVDLINAAYNSVLGFPALLERLDKSIKTELERKIPNYKSGVDSIKTLLQLLSTQLGAVRGEFDKLKDDAKAPAPAREYAGESAPRLEQIKKLADDELAKADALGTLKLDEIRKKLGLGDEEADLPPAIAVMGEDDIRLIDFSDVWKSGESTNLMATGGTPAKLRFAGEQRLTSAILALSQTEKKTVVFVRGGGPPVATGMMGEPARYAVMTTRLREYNYEVLERDISGQFAQMAAMRGRPVPEEASDEQLAKSLWIVINTPPQQQNPMMGMMPPSPEMANALKSHLDAGGNAVVLFDRESDPLAAALEPWGVRVNSAIWAVHEAIPTRGEPSGDMVEEARRVPPIFVVNQYGAHPMLESINALDAVLIPLFPVQKIEPLPAGVTFTPMLPLPADPKSWGESNWMDLMRGRPPTFDANSGDLPGPLFGGAIVEMKGKGRIVVIGSADVIADALVTFPDMKQSRQGLDVARFPGNSELFTNAVFWLTGEERLMALSPSAMETPRISSIKPFWLGFWRSIALIGLPAFAILFGLVVWRVRRD